MEQEARDVVLGGCGPLFPSHSPSVNSVNSVNSVKKKPEPPLPLLFILKILKSCQKKPLPICTPRWNHENHERHEHLETHLHTLAHLAGKSTTIRRHLSVPVSFRAFCVFRGSFPSSPPVNPENPVLLSKFPPPLASWSMNAKRPGGSCEARPFRFGKCSVFSISLRSGACGAGSTS